MNGPLLKSIFENISITDIFLEVIIKHKINILKKILLISHSSNKVGGGEDDFFRLLKYLQGKFIVYAILSEGDRAEEFAKLCFKYLIVPNKIFPFNEFKLKEYFIFFYITIIKLTRLIPFISENKTIDVCFVNSSVSFIEMRLLKHYKIPYIVSVKEKLNPGFLRRYVYKLIDDSAFKVITISAYLRDLLKQTIMRKEVKIIRTSIDEDIYDSFKAEVKIIKNKNKFVLLNIGQIYGLKNQKLLIEALHNLKDKDSILVKFIGFVADNKYNRELLKKISEYKLENIIEFCGALEKKEIISEYINSDAVVITSKEEGMSLVLVEALYFEKPVISTSVGVIPEVIRNRENGIIIQNMDPLYLAHSLYELISDKTFYNKIKNNSLNTFKTNFNLQNALEKHLQLFYEYINK